MKSQHSVNFGIVLCFLKLFLRVVCVLIGFAKVMVDGRAPILGVLEWKKLQSELILLVMVPFLFPITAQQTFLTISLLLLPHNDAFEKIVPFMIL